MKIYNPIFVIIFCVITSISFAQKMSPEEVVQENLDFYNQRNIEGFMASFSENIKVYELGSAKPSATGLLKVEKIYTELFKNSPKLHSTILKRIVMGNRVIDHESITGRNGNFEVLELVLIYEVENEKIIKITVIRK